MKAIPESWRWPLALLAAPLVVLATQDNSLFTPPGKLDPWLYLGYFRNLVDYKRNLFPDTYYGSRLPFLLPGAALHALFGTVVAGALLHLLFHSVATLSVYFAALAAAGRRAAYLTAFLFSVHPWVWLATGWDNPDGAAMTYLALSMALAARAGAARRPGWLLAGAGVAAAAAFYTNLFLALFVACVPLWYAAHAAGRVRAMARAALSAALWMAAGALLLSAALSAINYRIDGEWSFYAPSIRFAREHHAASSNPEPAWTPYGLPHWLWFAVAAAAVSLLLLPRRWREARAGRPAALALTLHFFFCGAAMWYLQATGPTVLGLYYYASYLLPLTFLAVAFSFWPAADALSPRQFGAAAIALAAGAAALWWDRGAVLPIWPHFRYAVIAAVAALLASGALFFARRRIGVAASLAGALLLTAEVRDARPADPHAWRSDYAALGAALDRITALRAGRSVRFWLDGGDDPSYVALASTYLNDYSKLGVRVPDDACREAPYPGDLVVLASRRAEAPTLARDALAACWADLGLAPAAAESLALRLSRAPFTATIFRAVDDPRWRTLPPFPLDRWKVWVHPHDRGSLTPEAAGVRAVTPAGGDYAFTYPPIAAPVDGRYRFTLLYAPVAGSIAFGVYRPADASWLKAQSAPRPLGDQRRLSVLMDLKAGDAAHLLIAGNATPDRRRAIVVLRELTVAVLAAPR
jgi:hypothetical protein